MVDCFLYELFGEKKVNNSYKIEVRVSISIWKCLVTYDVLLYTLFDLINYRLNQKCHLNWSLIVPKYFLSTDLNVIVFFPLPFIPLMPSYTYTTLHPHEHHTVVCVQEFFFFLCLIPPSLNPHPGAVSLLPIYATVCILLVS